MFTRGFCSFCLHLLTAITLFLPSLARVMALDVLRPPDWMPRDYGLAEASAPKTAFFAAASLSLLRGSLGQHAQGRSFRVRVLQMCRAIPHAELQTLAQPAHARKLLRPLWFSVEAREPPRRASVSLYVCIAERQRGIGNLPGTARTDVLLGACQVVNLYTSQSRQPGGGRGGTHGNKTGF